MPVNTIKRILLESNGSVARSKRIYLDSGIYKSKYAVDKNVRFIFFQNYFLCVWNSRKITSLKKISHQFRLSGAENETLFLKSFRHLTFTKKNIVPFKKHKKNL